MYQVVCLRDHPELLEDCAKLLNTQWPRSLNSRLRSLEQSNISTSPFPASLLLIQKKDDTTSVIGHSKISPVPCSDSSCFVESVVIETSLRNKGLGRIIMDETEKFVKERGIKAVHLTTHDQQGFYLKLGYQLSQPIVIYGGISSSLQKLIETHDKHNDESPNKEFVKTDECQLPTVSNPSQSCQPLPPSPPPPPMIQFNNNLLEKKVYMDMTSETSFGEYGALATESVKSESETAMNFDDDHMISSSTVEVKEPLMPGTPPETVDFIPFEGDDLNEFNSLAGSKKSGKKKVTRYWKAGDNENEPGAPKKGKKRRSTDMAGGAQRKAPKITPDKTASSILHELCPTLEYVYGGMEGPAHEPSFTVKVFYPSTNKEYVATGRSKKLGKNNVAAKILEDLGITIPKPEENVPAFQQQPSNIFDQYESNFLGPQMDSAQAVQKIDFASDDVMFEDDFNATPAPPQYTGETQLSYYLRNLDPKVIHRIRNIPNLDKNSCLAINSLNMSPEPAVYNFVSEDGPPHAKTFIYKLNYLNMEFLGRGNSKKLAKADAARKCLNLILTQITPMNYTDNPDIVQDGHQNDPDAPEFNVAFSDHVYSLVNEKYEQILRDDPEHVSQKVMAGIVMTSGRMIETTQVIAVSTGTKCIEGDSMSELGLALNDCHAEILATRCLRDYFYSQLDALVKNSDNNDSIFEMAEDSADGSKRFKLKPEIKFHLYISTSPCGDARIFSPKGYDENIETSAGGAQADSHPNRINRGLLRAKIEAGEGTIPVLNLNKGPQTWDAILQGNALNTMSCSDKVCRWNVLGLQGALLANLMDPIYYSSIILGSLHHPVHFRRAVIGRVEDLEAADLPLGYKVNKPYLLMISSEEARRVKKSPNHAITWCISWSSHEVLSAAKGRVKVGNVPSRVSKRQAFVRFLNILKTDRQRLDTFTGISYGDAKGQALNYKEAKDKFNSLMSEGNLGTWISKPAEQDSFCIT